MAISKKGFRSLHIEGKTYYWKFNEKVFVNAKAFDNSLLIIDFGWYDIWLFGNDQENRPPDFEPQTATPAFVAQSILFAIKNGWKEGKLALKFRHNQYTIV